MKIEEIDLARAEFWSKSLGYREEAFDLLRSDDPYRYLNCQRKYLA